MDLLIRAPRPQLLSSNLKDSWRVDVTPKKKAANSWVSPEMSSPSLMNFRIDNHFTLIWWLLTHIMVYILWLLTTWFLAQRFGTPAPSSRQDILLAPINAAGDLVTKSWYSSNFRAIRELVQVGSCHERNGWVKTHMDGNQMVNQIMWNII